MMQNLNNDSCPFCDGNHLKRFFATAHDAPSKTVSIIECSICQAAWQWPLQRTEQQSSEEFKDSYSQKNEGSYFDQTTRESVANFQRAFLNERINNPGRLLDIGCGDGTFARSMANIGWNVVGLDPALRSNTTEERDIGSVNLRNEALSDLQQEPFDLITLWDVVEHIERPDVLISQASKLLAQDGILVLETGNYQSAGRILGAEKWWNYQIDHRWYFAPPQLKEMLRSAGLNQSEISSRVLRPWWKGQTSISSPTLVSLFKAILRKPWRAITTWKNHCQLVKGAKLWKEWGGLEIVTILARK